MYGKQFVNHVWGAVRRYVSLGLATRAAKGIDSLDPDILVAQGRDVLVSDDEDVAFAEVALAAKVGEPVCANCGAVVPGAFCGVCGQKDKDISRPLWSFMAEFSDDVISLDSRIVTTLVPLLFLPGALTRSFWEGRRARYIPPIRLYLLSSLFFFLVVMVADVAILKFKFTPPDAGPEKVQSLEQENENVAEPADARDETTRQLGALTGLDGAALEAVKDELSDAQIERLRDVEGRSDDDRVIALGSSKSGKGYDMDVEMFVPISDIEEGLIEENMFADTIEDIAVEEAEAREAGDEFETQALGFIQSVIMGLRRATTDPGKMNGALNDALPWAMVFLLPVFAIILRIFYWGREHRIVKQLIFSLHFHSYIFLVLAFLIIAQAVWGGAVSSWMFFAAVPLYLFLALKVASRQGWFRTAFKFIFVAFFYMIIMSLTLTTTVLVGLSEL